MRQREQVINEIVDLDGRGADLYLNRGELNASQLKSLIRLATTAGKASPVLCGSAFKTKLSSSANCNSGPLAFASHLSIGARAHNDLAEARFACYSQPVCAYSV